MRGLIDTHCHLNLPDAFADPDAAIVEARNAGVQRLVVIGIDLPSSRRAIEIAEAQEGVFATVGVHPNSASEAFSAQELAEMARHPKVVAIGEVGLDYHWDFASKEQQVAALDFQLDLAALLGKPIVFHCREAYADLLTVLESRAKSPCVLHCFSGSAQDAERAMALDCYFGVDGPITYPKASELREIVARLPKDRLLVETDSPYLAPAPFRGRPNRPAYVAYVNRALAAVLGMGESECAALTTENAERFFSLA